MGSEFRYRSPVVDQGTLFVVITQSGETADTVAAQKLAREMGLTILTITNVVGSMTTRLSRRNSLYPRWSGDRSCVYQSLYSAADGAISGCSPSEPGIRLSMSAADFERALVELTALPQKIEQVLQQESSIENIARALSHSDDFLFLGRGIHFPIALEGALKT